MSNFTKEDADNAKEAVEEMFKALPKSKQGQYIGHLNEVFLFIEAAKTRAPTEEEASKEKSR